MTVRTICLALTVLWLAGCSFLPNGGKKHPDRSFLLAPAAAAAPAARDCGSVQVGSGSAASGFRSRRMAYMRDEYQIEYFAYARWADAPARLLSDQVRRYLDASGAFAAVLASPTSTRTDMYLELADVMFVQRFSGEASQLHLELDARIYGADRAQLLSARRFALTEPAGAGPDSGVRAANRAVAALLPQLHELVVAECGGAD